MKYRQIAPIVMKNELKDNNIKWNNSLSNKINKRIIVSIINIKKN